MQLYNPHTYTKLGFNVILKETARLAVSEDAKTACEALLPVSDPDRLLNDLYKVREMKDILDFDDAMPFNSFSSVGAILNKANVENNWVSVEELNRIYKWLMVIKQVRTYLTRRKEKYPYLYGLMGDSYFAEGLIKDIENILDETGNIRDNATPELASIRKGMKAVSIELRTVLHRILRHALENNWTVEKEITLRNDRLVIPIKADAKGRIPGFIQDISQSGQTVFVEPTESLVLNNRMREFQILENNEIIRILTEITEKIRIHIESLWVFKEIITEIDIIRAKALLAIALKANLPKISQTANRIHIRKGFYPLLQLRKSQQNSLEIIPLDVTLEKKTRILIISGPNAGGKSVALKTVGLLQVMLQSGFLIPVDERSEFRFFDSLFIDLGDEQSVENDLSTYTSHLFRMRQMGDKMSANSLFLIDEFGGGTDPKLGGAIAESFLERFIRQGAFGIITTHYGNLKEYAQTHEGVANGAMEFDTLELKPTYKLLMGVPGRSYAFEIAERVGVHRTIVQKAKTKLGKEVVHTEELIQEMEKKSLQLSQVLNQNEKKAQELASLKEKYDLLRIELKQNKRKILNDAKIEAKRLIKTANQKIEQTIREIRENKAEKEITKQLRKELDDAIPNVEEIVANPAEPAENGIKIFPKITPKVGDWVKLKQANSYGQLVELNGNKAMVLIGELRTSAKLNQLVKIELPETTTKTFVQPALTVNSFKFTSPKIEVLGMRIEEALPLIEKKIDDAVWAGLKTISILHGKGTGALREAIRKHLRDFKVVASVSDAPLDMGGDGWTVVELV